MGKVLSPNYFSFCLQNDFSTIPDFIRESFFSGTANTLTALMAAYWRVKEWRVDYSAYANDGSPITASGVYGFDVNQEEELICPKPFIEKSFSFSGISIFQEHNFGIFNYYSNLYYGANVLNGFAFQLLYYGADEGTGGAFAYSGTADICGGRGGIGGTLVVPVANAGQVNFPYKICGDTEGRFGTIAITPQSYWAYGGTYDTATGFPL